jgi:hypothetical protein
MTVETIMITKMTGQTVVVPPCVFALRGSDATGLLAATGRTLTGLAVTGLAVTGLAVSGRGVSGLGHTAGADLSGTGLSGSWTAVRSERPTEAPKAAVAAAEHGGYARVIGAGHQQKQNEQLIDSAMAAFLGAEAVRMRAFRGPGPWRERP